MSSNSSFPDYELAEHIDVSLPGQLRAFSDPLRVTILDLLLERAATVRDLAAAVGRPRSTVAYHVKVLVEAGMLRVVRTRRVHAIEERHYGRTARMFAIGIVDLPGGPVWANAISEAATESGPAHEADRLRTVSRHVRIPDERAGEFWERVEAVAREFTQLSRSGDTVYGFVAGLYPTDHPALPDPGQVP